MWDIPSGTGLAIQFDTLPVDAPQAAVQGLPLSGHNYEQNGSVAVIDISGVITPYPNILSALFGGVDIQTLGDQFAEAMEDPDIDGVILRIDSPGGLITGVQELASTIAAARGQKPIIAYAYGNAASAAYWLAAAADKIVAGPTTSLGSIGVAMAVAKDKDQRWVRFVSSNAPDKQLDPDSEAGQDSIQRRLDAMEDEFIGAIASYRAISKDKIIKEFGRGDVLPARQAVRVGMADIAGGFKDALALIQELQPPKQGATMNEKTKAPDAMAGDENMIHRDKVTADFLMKEFPKVADVLMKEGRVQAQVDIQKQGYDEGFAAGAVAERERIMALEDMALAGHEDLLAEAKKDGKTQPGDLAMKIVAMEKKRGDTFLQDRRADASAHKDVGPSVEMTGGDMADPAAPVEERAKAEWNKDPKIRAEFDSMDSYVAYRKAEEEGRVRRFAAK